MNEEKEELNENINNQTRPKHSIFQITCIVLIVLLICASLVEMCVIISLKSKTDEMNKKLKQLPQQPAAASFQSEVLCCDDIFEGCFDLNIIF